MRVGFDLAPLVRPHSFGLQRVVRSTWEALAACEALEAVPLTPPAGVGSLAWRQGHLPRLVRRLGLAGVHSFVSAFPLFGPGVRLHTVHELPWRHGETENAGPRHRLWARHGRRRARFAVTASARVAAELAAEDPSRAERIRVVPWGLEAAWRDWARGGAPEPHTRALGLDPGYLLMLGGTRPKKRLERALEAAARLEKPPALVVTGPPTPALLRARERANALQLTLVHALGEAGAPWPEEDLPGLVAGAGCVLALARSEGFCLPVLEALALGCPVVVPAQSVQAETAGGLGECASVEDTADLSAAIQRALDSRERNQEARRARALPFDPARTAAEIARLWGEPQ